MPPRPQVLWKYTDKDKNQPHMIWSTGRVVRVADGLSDMRSKRARSVLPAGAVLWAWDADPEFDEAAGEQWLFLLPKKWSPKTHKQVYSWRSDPRELGAVEAPTRHGRPSAPPVPPGHGGVKILSVFVGTLCQY